MSCKLLVSLSALATIIVSLPVEADAAQRGFRQQGQRLHLPAIQKIRMRPSRSTAHDGGPVWISGMGGTRGHSMGHGNFRQRR